MAPATGTFWQTAPIAKAAESSSNVGNSSGDGSGCPFYRFEIEHFGDGPVRADQFQQNDYEHGIAFPGGNGFGFGYLIADCLFQRGHGSFL